MVSNLLKSKWLIELEDPKQSFKQKTIIVTGASRGIGLEAAKKLIKLNCSHVILAVRDLESGERVKSQLQQHLDNNESEGQQFIDVWKLDLMDYDSIYAFSKRVDEEIECLDGIILNAGIMKAQISTSKYGWEETLQVNTLSTILLAILLLPKLMSSKTATTTPVLEIIISSLYTKQHFHTKEEQEKSGGLLQSYNPTRSDSYNPFTQYNSSKLLLLYAFTFLASKIKSEQIQIIFVSPGLVASDLGREFTIPLAFLLKPIFSTIFQRNTEQGSRSYISGLLFKGDESHGKIWQHDQLKDFTPNEMKDEEGKNISDLVWQAIIDVLAKEDKENQFQNALKCIQQE